VVADGGRVAAGLVDFKSKARSETKLLDPSRNGELTFFGVPYGSVTVSVKIVTNGADLEPIKQVFDVPEDREEPTPIFTVSVPGKVATVIAEPDSEGTQTTSTDPEARNESESKQKSETNGGSILGSVVAYLLGLTVVGAMIYFALNFYKQNQKTVDDKLKELGVQVPQPADPNAVAPNQPLPDPPKQPAPMQKIVLDPTVADPSGSTPVAQMASTDEPRLVTASGDVIPLTGEIVVGREAGLGLSLTGESTVSRRHASIHVSVSGNVTVTDQGSTNGTYVNGAKVQGTSALRPGDTVQFGEAKFRFEA
jgi:hypothetical protein